MQAQIIRFPIERCRPRSSVDVTALMFAPMFFYLTMTTILMAPVTCERNDRRNTNKAADGAIRTRRSPLGLGRPCLRSVT